MNLNFKALGGILIFLTILIYSSFSQNAQPTFKVVPDNRLYDAFGKSFVDKMVVENPDYIIYFNYFLDHSYYLVDLPVGKEDFVSNLDKLDFPDSLDLSQLNILKYNISLDAKHPAYYRVGNSDKVVVFYTAKEFFKKYNDFRVSLGLNEKRK